MKESKQDPDIKNGWMVVEPSGIKYHYIDGVHCNIPGLPDYISDKLTQYTKTIDGVRQYHNPYGPAEIDNYGAETKETFYIDGYKVDPCSCLKFPKGYCPSKRGQ